MSDLSVPPLSLVPIDGQAPLRLGPGVAVRSHDPTQGHTPDSSSEPLRQEPFAWPTPDLPCYPAPTCQTVPEACEIEGLNGHTMIGRLVTFHPADGVLQVVVPPSRSAIPLRFSQFRRLRLQAVLEAQQTMERTAPMAHDAEGADRQDTITAELDDLPLHDTPALPYRIHMRSGAALKGMTICPLQTEHGVFLFEPIDTLGGVQRSFVPRAAYSAIETGLRLGDALVVQPVASTQKVEAALPEQQALRVQKVGDMLLTRQITTPEELVDAIDQQARMPMVRIGEALIALGLITTAQLDGALLEQRRNRSVPLGELLVRRGDVSRQDLQTALARKMGYPLVDVAQFPFDLEAVARLPYPVAHRLNALPLLQRAGRLIVAVVDPTRGDTLDEIEFAAQGKVVPVLARAGLLHDAIDRAYEMMGAEVSRSRVPGDPGAGVDFDADNANQLLATLEQQQTAESRRHGDGDPAIEQSDNSLVRLINSMIIEAQAQGVSDIHIECQPGRDKVRVRFRKDGELRPYLELPHTYRNALIARLKIMCDLDISERRKPQDGKINFGKFVQGQKLELRVATIPTHGNLEDAVLRLLASAKPIALDNLGLSPTNLRRFKEAVQRPYGMLLSVGPTGSGKTTTLHSAMGFINQPHRKLWTAEDPIEITQPGLRQVQVNPKIDWTFAKALRSFLRADPDVIMVGEIRDRETAQVAIEASLTGHLVMSTLHTNSAPETITRLLDMGLDPFSFADSLLAVLAQRLVRRWCAHCVTAKPATVEDTFQMLDEFLNSYPDPRQTPDRDRLLSDWIRRFGVDGTLQIHHAPGCTHCNQSGFSGRVGLHELMVISREIRRLIQTKTRAEDLQRVAMSEGMRTLRQDGILKVLAGQTSIGEVRATSNG